MYAQVHVQYKIHTSRTRASAPPTLGGSLSISAPTLCTAREGQVRTVPVLNQANWYSVHCTLCMNQDNLYVTFTTSRHGHAQNTLLPNIS
jgi:hypothetical protein